MHLQETQSTGTLKVPWSLNFAARALQCGLPHFLLLRSVINMLEWNCRGSVRYASLTDELFRTVTTSPEDLQTYLFALFLNKFDGCNRNGGLWIFPLVLLLLILADIY
jgi:hypothetical protein